MEMLGESTETLLGLDPDAWRVNLEAQRVNRDAQRVNVEAWSVNRDAWRVNGGARRVNGYFWVWAYLTLSFPRKWESSIHKNWTPAFAGVTRYI